MPKRKMLVCGATGFIGRNMAEYFAGKEEFEVHGTYHNSQPYENPNINLVHADLRREEEVRKVVEGSDIILQMAATTTGSKDVIERPYIHVTDNAVMNSLLLRAAFDNKISHFVFPSCTTMYDSSDKPIREEDFNGNFDKKYFGVAWTKVYIEKMCEFFSKLGRTRHTVMRHSNIYGPYDKFDLERSHVFGATVTKVLTAKDKITVWGTGEEERDLIYVSDLVNFVDLALRNQETSFGLYNVGYGSAIPVGNLVKKIIEHSGREIGIEFDATKPTIKTRVALDISRAEREIGWHPEVSLDEGIEKTLGWYKHGNRQR